MSRTYHKYYSYAAGYNTEYYRSCARMLRNKHRQMLRNLLSFCELEELSERLYNIPKKECYDLWGAPMDFISYVSQKTFRWLECFGGGSDMELPFKSPSRNIRYLKTGLIIRSKLKGYPLHSRKRYSFKELISDEQ